MAKGGEKVRFAMALFDEPGRLSKAVEELLGLGLDPSCICLAGERPAVEKNNTGFWANSAAIPLEHFPVKWMPVYVEKMRPNKELEPRPDSIGVEKALRG